MSAIDAIRGQEIKVLNFFLFLHCYHLLSLFKVLKFFFIFTLLSPTITFKGAEVDRQALGSRQLYFLFRSLPHDSRNLPHLHIQVETDRVLNLLLIKLHFFAQRPRAQQVDR